MFPFFCPPASHPRPPFLRWYKFLPGKSKLPPVHGNYHRIRQRRRFVSSCQLYRANNRYLIAVHTFLVAFPSASLRSSLLPSSRHSQARSLSPSRFPTILLARFLYNISQFCLSHLSRPFPCSTLRLVGVTHDIQGS